MKIHFASLTKPFLGPGARIELFNFNRCFFECPAQVVSNVSSHRRLEWYKHVNYDEPVNKLVVTAQRYVKRLITYEVMQLICTVIVALFVLCGKFDCEYNGSKNFWLPSGPLFLDSKSTHRCYVCNSMYDKYCSDVSHVHSKRLIMQCPSAEIPTRCRKMIQHSKFAGWLSAFRITKTL